jgi:flagellar hook-length control protein FliK
MIEGLVSQEGTAASPRAKPRDDAPTGFSFAFAVSALETRAAQSLQVHGATPQENTAANARTNNAEKQSPRAEPRGVAEPSDMHAAAKEQKHSPDAAGARDSIAQATPQHRAAALVVNLAATATPTPAPLAGQGPATQTTAAPTKADAAAARVVETAKPQSPKAPLPAMEAQKPAPPTQDFAALLARRLNGGATQFELRLDPPELGRVEASLRLADDGDNVLALKFENQSALDLFARDEAALRNTLLSSGFDLGRERIVFSLAHDEEATSTSPAISAATYEPAFIAPWSAGAVDIRI